MTESITSAATPDVTAPVEESLDDLYENAPCGHLSTTLDGVVIKVNNTYLMLTGYTREQVVGRPFDSMLAAGSHLLWETRCLPILRLKGEAREVAIVVTT